MSVVSLQSLDSVHNEGGDGALSSAPNNPPAIEGTNVNNEAGTFRPGARFWAIIFALCVSAVCSSLEGTIVSTALPSIVRDLGGGDKFLWAANAYFLTSAVFQPLYGQTANIFGRRYLMITAVALFILGSGISGGALNMSILIVGRAIQGAGGGGISMLCNLIICDLVPLRQRGSYTALIFIAITAANGIGPFVGGIIVQRTTWRWVFWLNLPIGGLTLLLLIVFLQVGYKKEPVMAKLKRIDYIGNAIFVPSLVSILLGLTYGGTQWPWSSWHIVVPLVCGFFGFGAFLAYEASRFCLEPTTPPRLFANRTSAAAFALTFLHSLLTFWTVYYLPVYFQAVLRSTPSRSGVQLLPTVTVLIPFAALSGKFLARIGRYRPFHHLGFALMIIGLGLFTLLDSTSPTGAWVGFQIIEAAGAGLVVSTLLPAVQVGLSETDTATAAGTFAFIRSFGIIWGVAIPAAIFNTQSGKLSYRVSDPAVRASLANGQAYEHATREFVLSFQGNLRYEITGVYSDSLKVVWQVALGIACLGFLLVSVEKELTLRTSVKSDFGMVRKEATIHPEDADDVPLRAV